MSKRPPALPDRFQTPPSNDELECQLTQLVANINAAQSRFLLLLAEFDRREAWADCGIRSCAHWLNWKCGISLGPAREKVRVARALEALPQTGAAFAAGEISYSKVRAMTRVATPENEDYLLMIARHGTAMHMEKLVRQYRGLSRMEANQQQQRRSLNYYWDEDGCLVIKARLPAEQGAQVLKALDAAVEVIKEEEEAQKAAEIVSAETQNEHSTQQEEVSAETPEVDIAYLAPDDEELPNFAARRADALGLMVDTFMAAGPRTITNAERFQVVVHVAEESLKRPETGGCCELEEGHMLAPDTVRRLGCEASRVQIVEDSDGMPLSVGRKTRAIPPAIRRALQARDGGCRFPGCTAHRFTDAHHIQHWADGGETRLDNLVLLCKHHHRQLHEGGFGLKITSNGLLRFFRPDGRLIETAPITPPATQTVEQVNRELGLTIEAETGVTLWEGEEMDYGMAVEGLLQADGELIEY